MRKKTKARRIVVRAPDPVLDLLRRAAALLGLPLADYLGQVLTGAAKVVEVQEAARAG